MTQSENDKNPHQLPDNGAWQRAFAGADETPPPRLWSAIEAELDGEKRGRVLPLWLNLFGQPNVARPGVGPSSMRWTAAIAASLALLLVGWWLFRSAPDATENVANQARADLPADAVAQRAASSGQKPDRIGTDNKAIQPDVDNVVTKANTPGRSAPQSGEIFGQGSNAIAQNLRIKETPTERPSSVLLGKQHDGRSQSGKVLAERTATEGIATSARPETALARVATKSNDAAQPDARLAQTLVLSQNATFPESVALLTAPERLTQRPLQLRRASMTRVVWYRVPDELGEAIATPVEKQTKTRWASVSVMPSAFDAGVALRSAAGVSNAFSARNGAVTSAVSSQASASVAYQAGGGIQLSDRWSVETGVGYMQGRTTVESPAIALVAMTADKNASSSLFTNAVQNGGNAVNDDMFSFASNNTFLPSALGNQAQYNALGTTQTVTSTYTSVQVPVQVGYQLRPRKKFGLALIGGFLANVFVRNTVGTDVTVRSADGLYRPLTWAAQSGVRLRYQSSRRWSTSLAGVYQQSLQSLTRPDVELFTRPQAVGMSFGLDYHF